MYNEHLSPPMMTDRARRICDELGVCREEAIFYLEGFDWDLDAAMEACRSRTLDLPSLTAESQPEKEKSSSEAPSLLPLTTDSQSRNELIAQFYNFAVGSDTRDARSYLERNDWDLQRAVLQFFEERRPTPSQRKLNRKLGRLDYLQGETSAAAGILESIREEKVPKAIPPLVSSHLKIHESASLVQDKEEKLSAFKKSAEWMLSSKSLSQQTNTSEEKLSQWKEDGIESFFNVAIGASREAAIACLSHCKWNQEDAISYFFGDYAEDIEESTSPVQESVEALSSSMSLIQLKNSPEEQLSRLKKEIVKSFRDVVIVASRKDAEACLSHCKWNQEDAISYFLGDYTKANPEIAWSQTVVQESASPVQSMSSSQLTITPEQQLFQWEEESIKSFRKAAIGASRVAAITCLRHCKWNQDDAISYFYGDDTEATPGTGKAADKYSSTKSLEKAGGEYFTEGEKTTQVQAPEESETGGSSSSSNADPTKAGNVTVAVPEDASSQVDDNVKDEDVEEELSAVPIASTTIELEIVLDDGESGTQVWIIIRSDQTVRDLHRRVNAFRPEDKKEYYFKSDTGVEYRDLDTTVHRITSGSRGSTILHQIYST